MAVTAAGCSSCGSMMRSPHKVGHPECPHASWAACDKAAKVAWGQCKAIVGEKEPEPCSRWAVSTEGWCWQHYVSEKDRVIREDRIAIARAEQAARIDEYIAWVADHPSVHDTRLPTRSRQPTLPPQHEVRKVYVAPVKRKPFRLTELA